MRYDRAYARHPYGFLTGLLTGLSADWSGRGPVYRRWQMTARHYYHFYGVVCGFLIDMGLIVAVIALVIFEYDTVALVLAWTLTITIILANFIASRLP